MATTEPIRVLHLNSEPGFRGGEVQTLGLAARLHALGHDSCILSPGRHPLSGRAREEGVPWRHWHPRGELDPLAVLRLRREIRGHAPQILHAHTAHTLTLALLARGIGKGLLVVGSRRVSFPIRGRLSRLKYGRADAILAVSHAVADGLLAQGLPEKRVFVVHSGMDPARFASLPGRSEARRAAGIPGDCPLIGTVGALCEQKGPGDLLDALRRIRRTLPDARAVLAGSGPLEASLRSRSESEGLPVHFLGYVREPAHLYPALDLFLLPALSGEGSPGVIKEAAACAVPVVATRVGGTEEILRDGREALLVPPSDPKALADAAIRVLTEAGLAARLSEAALARIPRFSLDETARKTEDIYRLLLAR